MRNSCRDLNRHGDGNCSKALSCHQVLPPEQTQTSPSAGQMNLSNRGLLGGGEGRAIENWGRLMKAEYVIFISIFVLYSFGTCSRNNVWLDDLSLWSETVNRSPNKARSHHSLGLAYEKKGMLDEAISELKKVLTVHPNYYKAHNNLGVAYQKKGMLDEAIAEFKKSIAMNPNYYMSYTNLGIAYGKKGMLDEAISELKKALTIDPDYYKAYYNLGVAYQKKGMLDEAIAEFKKSIAMNPEFSVAHVNLAIAYYYKRDYSEAITHCDLAIKAGAKVDPQFLRLLESYR
jgi:tetratricopeptide (TPR) repeat protein